MCVCHFAEVQAKVPSFASLHPQNPLDLPVRADLAYSNAAWSMPAPRYLSSPSGLNLLGKQLSKPTKHSNNRMTGLDIRL